MTQLTLISMMILVSFTFTQMTHPLAMGLILLLQTLLVVIFTGLLGNSFWFSYILFLVFLGGMLVLFVYVTSLASNEMFNISTKPLIMLVLMISTLMISFTFNDFTLWMTTNLMTQLDSMFDTQFLSILPSITLKIYHMPSSIITLLLVIYLFLTLIAVVTVTNIFAGPLRSKH